MSAAELPVWTAAQENASKPSPAWVPQSFYLPLAGVAVAALPSVAIYLLIILSIAFSELFTLLPAMILHAILR